jgi:hypothetical protein
VLGKLTSRNAKNANAQHRKKKTPLNIATTAAAVTEAERFAGESIECLYSTSRVGVEEDGESNTK